MDAQPLATRLEAAFYDRQGCLMRQRRGDKICPRFACKPEFIVFFAFLAAKIFRVKPLTSHTCKLTDAQASALNAALQARHWKPRTVPYARFAFEADKCNVVFYESGKLVVQGKGTQEFIEFILEPEILQQAKLGYETVLNPDLLLPRFGVDESGKGDFFGPLCIAGVYVNETIITAWKDAGIRD